jgi:hypothetical protein
MGLFMSPGMWSVFGRGQNKERTLIVFEASLDLRVIDVSENLELLDVILDTGDSTLFGHLAAIDLLSGSVPCSLQSASFLFYLRDLLLTVDH